LAFKTTEAFAVAIIFFIAGSPAARVTHHFYPPVIIRLTSSSREGRGLHHYLQNCLGVVFDIS